MAGGHWTNQDPKQDVMIMSLGYRFLVDPMNGSEIIIWKTSANQVAAIWLIYTIWLEQLSTLKILWYWVWSINLVKIEWFRVCYLETIGDQVAAA